MSEISTHPTISALRSAREFAEFLEEHIGVRFALCAEDEVFQGQPTDPFPSLITGTDLRGMAVAVGRRGFALCSCDERHTSVAILVPDLPAEDLLAIGVVPTKQTSILERLITTTLQLASHHAHLQTQSQELDSCLEQITYDMEEQTWLRTIADQMRLCDVRVTVKSMAEELLSSLQGLIHAESVAWFQSDQSESQNNVTWIGPQFVNDQLWRQWLWEGVSDDSLPRVRIANGGRVDPIFRASGVDSIIAVPMTSSHRLSGWLVAANRLVPQSGRLSDYGCCECEFGTIEAGLMGAAATLLATHAHNVELLHEQEDLVMGVIRSMSSAIDARDPYTRGHSDRVAWYAKLIAEQLGLPIHQQDRLYTCGLMHDIGKIGVPDDVLLKRGKLTDDEFELIKQHPQIGHEIVKNLQQFNDLLPGILHHHEAVDGSGYPHGLIGDQIPLQARILAVADAFDAMTSSRVYRDGMSEQKALSIMRERSGIQWDAGIVRAFLRIPVEKRRGHAHLISDLEMQVDTLQQRIALETLLADAMPQLTATTAEFAK